MKLKRLFLVISILLAVGPQGLMAYEPETHVKMSEAAAQTSVLKDTSPNGVLQSLGLNYPIDDPTGTQVFPNSKGTPETILGLIEDGARFEDGFDCTDTRSRNHFFDPHSGSGLNWDAKLIGGIGTIHITGIPSPDWALEDNGKQPNQGYSWKSARNYLYQALTTSEKDIRSQNFGLTFQTLGQIIHHIEDMAQPQHVRNDPHYTPPPNCGPATYVGKLITENVSRYERYTDTVRDKLVYNTYAPVNQKNDTSFLTSARQFWIDHGLGIAEFTNTNFLSAGTNFDTQTYSSPTLAQATAHDDNANALLQSVKVSVPSECLPPNAPCVMTFYTTHVNDSYRPAVSADNLRASTESIFDQDLKANNLTPAFSLNRFNFNAAHEFLIPRAVGYSAGLINYFFRGKLEAQNASLSDDGTNLTVTLQVKNTVDPNDPAAPTDGLYAQSGQTLSTFTLTVHYTLNGQDQYAASAAVPMDPNQDTSIAPGQLSNESFTFSLHSVPPAATNVQFRIVFRGKLGQEDGAVAVGSANPVSGFVFTPNYPLADGIGGTRVIYQVGGPWKLSDQPNRLAGNLDWKGGYVGNLPTQVLSWQGPVSRYFADPDPLHYSFTQEVFQNGDSYAIAPGPVLGAAIAQGLDASGKSVQWLVVICLTNNYETVYRRPNKPSQSPDLYDPQTNPDGWQEIGNSASLGLSVAPDRAWFFNGSGTEAQTMRRDDSVLANGLSRLKLTILDNVSSAQFQNLGNLAGQTTTEYSTAASWTINPAPTLPPCPPAQTWSYSDSAHGQISYGTKDNGEYIVAADYTATGEILAKHVINGTKTTTEVYDRQEQASGSCDSSGKVTGSDTVSVRASSTFAWQYQETLTFGGTTVVLNTTDHNDSSSQNDTQSATTVDSYTQISTQSSYQSQGNDGDWIRNLIYLDLRNALAVVDTQSFDNTSSASGTDLNAIPYNKQSTTSMATDIQTAANPISVYSDTQSYSSSGTSAAGVVLSKLTSIGVVVPAYQNTLPPLAMPPSVDPNLDGSWAVDTAGNLFVSQSYYDINYNPYGHVFNYLTNGNLSQLLPPAPASAAYAPIGVIR